VLPTEGGLTPNTCGWVFKCSNFAPHKNCKKGETPPKNPKTWITMKVWFFIFGLVGGEGGFWGVGVCGPTLGGGWGKKKKQLSFFFFLGGAFLVKLVDCLCSHLLLGGRGNNPITSFFFFFFSGGFWWGCQFWGGFLGVWGLNPGVGKKSPKKKKKKPGSGGVSGKTPNCWWVPASPGGVRQKSVIFGPQKSGWCFFFNPQGWVFPPKQGGNHSRVHPNPRFFFGGEGVGIVAGGIKGTLGPQLVWKSLKGGPTHRLGTHLLNCLTITPGPQTKVFFFWDDPQETKNPPRGLTWGGTGVEIPRVPTGFSPMGVNFGETPTPKKRGGRLPFVHQKKQPTRWVEKKKTSFYQLLFLFPPRFWAKFSEEKPFFGFFGG